MSLNPNRPFFLSWLQSLCFGKEKKSHMPIEYALVAEGSEILAEEPATEKHLSGIAKLILAKIPKHNHKRTYQEERNNFHYKYSGTHVFLCVADRDYPLRICFAFLDDLETRYLQQGGRNLRAVVKERIVRGPVFRISPVARQP